MRHFTGLSPEVHRVGMTRVGPEDTKRAHGTAERVSVEGDADMVRFFAAPHQRGGVKPGGPDRSVVGRFPWLNRDG